MRILVAVNDKPFSTYTVNKVAEIAMGTWADVTLVGVLPKVTGNGGASGRNSQSNQGNHDGEKLLEALRRHGKEFLKYFENQEIESPYAKKNPSSRLVQLSPGIFQDLTVLNGARKEFNLLLREGNTAKEIIGESLAEESDLIVIGCPKGEKCQWPQGGAIPQKVVNDASCSVLVVKEDKKIEKIVCCLDHDNVSQESLEMINQMLTIHDAELELVGITDSGVLGQEIDKKMNQVLSYYQSQHIKSWIKLVDGAFLDDFISQAAHRDLIALWMGKRSILHKFFPKQRVNKLVNGAQSSVLILR